MCYPELRQQRYCVYTTYITWDKSPSPSRPSRIYPVLRDYETRLASKDSFLGARNPVRKCILYTMEEQEQEYRRRRSVTAGERQLE